MTHPQQRDEGERERRRAYWLLRTAVAAGRIHRPEKCERCGLKPGRARDGRPLIQGHHHDYGKPLDVEWICTRCHRRETPLPAVPGAPVFGERNGMRRHPELVHGVRNPAAKLTESDVAKIRAMKGKRSGREVGRLFGISGVMVCRIWRGLNWNSLKESA